MSKYTELEEQALKAAREGKKLSVTQSATEDGKPPVVTLAELAAGSTVNSPKDPDETDIMPRPGTVMGGEKFEKSDEPAASSEIDDLKRAVFGPEEKEETPAAETAADNDEAASTSRTVICQRCGWNTDHTPREVPTDEDKVEFIQSVLGERRFEKKMSFLDSKVEIMYQLPSVEEEDNLYRQLNKMVESGEIKTQAENTLLLTKCRLGMSVVEVTLDGKTRTYKKPEDMVDASFDFRCLAKDMSGKWPTSLQAMASEGLRRVDEVYMTLVARAYDPDFWGGLSEE